MHEGGATPPPATNLNTNNMENLGRLKFIIYDTEEYIKAEHYGLLIFNEITRKGELRIYNNFEEIKEVNYNPKKWDYINLIIRNARKKCEELNGQLWKY